MVRHIRNKIRNFEIKLETWKAIIIVCFAMFVVTAILEKVQIIINNRKDKSQD